jgi:hypothetical protein
MAFQYQYTTYDFHWPDAQQERLDQMVADGWQVNTAYPNSLELYVVWQRELPTAEQSATEAADAAFAAAKEAVANDLEQVSGSLRDHEGQVAR